ncbi:MFS transporter [Helicobacter sp. MIT 14-3879]|uniref:MFS transporter n=1 Tax=Helicobacter sp. MIT 14-3879 TaxID=2040649 RepID=UPI000E1E90D1|nr:MFS transporter [Helicobacter sp. MIT 14-3879]RDU60852.1 MFS transporter [Helicobacter sp. MIT 14-3879]
MKSNKSLWLFTILLAVFVVPSSISGTAIALPFIAQELGNQASALQWVVNAFNLFFASFTLIWGAMADKFGAKKCLLFGVFIYVLGSLLSIIARDLLLLDIARALAGIGGASVFACGASLLIRNFQEKERAKAFAFFGTTAGLGITFGPTISGLLIDVFASTFIGDMLISYRAIFGFHFLILTLVLLLSPILPKDNSNELAKNPFDILGAFLFVVSLFSFMAFITSLAYFDSQTLIALIVFVVCGGLFMGQQKSLHAKGLSPLLDLEVLKNKKFFGFSLVTVIAGFSFVVLLTYFPSFLQAVWDLSASVSGLYMLALTTPMLFCPFLVSKMLNAQWDTKRLTLMMSLLMSVGLIALAGILYFLPTQWQILPILLLLFIIGVGMGLHAGGIDNLALSSVDSSKAGLAAGVLNSCRLGSEAVGVALYGALMLVFITLSITSAGISTENIPIIASANLAMLEDKTMGLLVYLHSFCAVIAILGVICCFFCVAIWRLLKD